MVVEEDIKLEMNWRQRSRVKEVTTTQDSSTSWQMAEDIKPDIDRQGREL